MRPAVGYRKRFCECLCHTDLKRILHEWCCVKESLPWSACHQHYLDQGLGIWKLIQGLKRNKKNSVQSFCNSPKIMVNSNLHTMSFFSCCYYESCLELSGFKYDTKAPKWIIKLVDVTWLYSQCSKAIRYSLH